MAYLTWILGVLIADQISKVIVLTYIPPYQSVPLLKGFLRFTHIRNPGGAFGILRSYGLWIALITIAVSGVLLSLLLLGSIKSSTVKIGLAIIIGGALGNLIDRLRWGYVIDFIDFRMFPVFNLADMAIVVGTGLIFLILLKSTGAR